MCSEVQYSFAGLTDGSGLNQIGPYTKSKTMNPVSSG